MKTKRNGLRVLAAQDVLPGHELYNILARHPAYRWSRVKEVIHHGNRITLVSQSFTTVKHPREGVMVRTQEEPCLSAT